PETDLAGTCLGIGRELGNRLSWNRLIYHHDEREADDASDGRDVAKKNEIELVVERCVDCVRRTYHKDRVAIRRRSHDRLGANIAAATRAIFYDEWLAEPLRQPRSDKPRENVGRASGCRGCDYVHRSRWIILRPSNGRNGQQHGRARGQM